MRLQPRGPQPGQRSLAVCEQSLQAAPPAGAPSGCPSAAPPPASARPQGRCPRWISKVRLCWCAGPPCIGVHPPDCRACSHLVRPATVCRPGAPSISSVDVDLVSWSLTVKLRPPNPSDGGTGAESPHGFKGVPCWRPPAIQPPNTVSSPSDIPARPAPAMQLSHRSAFAACPTAAAMPWRRAALASRMASGWVGIETGFAGCHGGRDRDRRGCLEDQEQAARSAAELSAVAYRPCPPSTPRCRCLHCRSFWLCPPPTCGASPTSAAHGRRTPLVRATPARRCLSGLPRPRPSCSPCWRTTARSLPTCVHPWTPATSVRLWHQRGPVLHVHAHGCS